MGILSRYGILYQYDIDTKPEVKKSARVNTNFIKYEVPESRPITIADINVVSGNYITAHDLSDYRRASFNLTLLPEVELQSDIIAREVYGLSEYL